MATFRSMKQEFSSFLPQDNWQAQLEAYYVLPLRKVLGPLFSLLLAPEPLLKWRAVSAFGLTVARLAERDMESARIIMRRLMWNLNEESGAIGWGAPESMGDSLARCTRLAVEFHRILISYAQEPERGDGNYLDHEPLRRGAYWGMARLAEVRPDLVQQGLPTFLGLLADADPLVRALGVWGVGSVGSTEEDLNALRAMLADQSPVMVYRNDQLLDSNITSLAQEALDRFKQ